jgi:hypothetical protein
VSPRVRRTWRFLRSKKGDPLPFLEGVHPYHGTSQATGRNPRQRFALVRAVFAAVPFATHCDQLRPLGSIKAHPSLPMLTTSAGALPAPCAAGYGLGGRRFIEACSSGWLGGEAVACLTERALTEGEHLGWLHLEDQCPAVFVLEAAVSDVVAPAPVPLRSPGAR